MAAVKIIGQVAVKVYPDTSDFKNDLKRDLERIERGIGPLKVDVVPKISKAAEKKVAADLKALRERLSHKNIDLDLDLDNAAVAGVETALKVLTRGRKVKIGVDVDRATFANLLENILMIGGARPQLDALAESFKKLGNLDYISIAAGKLALQIALISGAAIAATGQLFSLTGSLASIVKVGFVLPGILGGIVVALGATAAAFADFNQYVPQAAGYMRELQDVISARFWENAAVRINAFVDAVFPILLSNLARTGTALGEFFGSLAESFGTNLNPGLEQMFDGLVTSIQIATGHTDAYATIIRILGETGASYLPRFAEWFGQINEQFAAFLTRAQGDGTLQGWINEGIQSLVGLGNVLLYTTSIFRGLSQAATAAGGATLTSLAAGLKDIAAVVNSAPFQEGMTAVFKAAYDMMGQIANTAGPGLKTMLLSLRDVFVSIGPGLGASVGGALNELFAALGSPQAASGVTALFDGIKNALTSITPAIAPLVGIFASMGPVTGALLTQISALISDGIARLAPTMEKVSGAAVPLINTIGGLFQSIANDLIPVFQKMGENVSRVVSGLSPLFDALQDLWNLLAPVLIPVLKIVVTIIGDALVGVVKGLTMVFTGLVQIINGVVEVFKGIWDVVAGLFTLDFDRVGKGIGEVFGGLKDIVLGALEGVAGAIWAWLNGSLFGVFRRAAGKLLTPLVNAFKSFGKYVGEAFKYVTRSVDDGVNKTGEILSRLYEVLMYPFERFLPNVASVLHMAFGIIKSIFTGAFGVIKTIVSTAFNVLVTIFGGAFKVIGEVVTTAWGIIKTIFQTAWDAIKTLVKGAWKGITDYLFDALQGLYKAFGDTWNLITDLLELAWTYIKTAAFRIFDAIKEFFFDFLMRTQIRIETVWNGIKTFFTTIWNGIKTVFTGAGNSIKSFLGETWDAIKNKVHNVWTNIKDWIKERWELIKADVEIAVAFVRNKMSDAWDLIKSKVLNVWNDIKGTISEAWEGIKTKVGNSVDNVKETMADAWEKVKTKVGNAWDDVKTTVTTKIGDVKDEIAKLPNKAVNALAGIGGVLVNAGEQLIGGLIEGITNMEDDLEDKLGWLSLMMPVWKGPPDYDAVLLTPAGRLIMDGLIAGLESRYGAVLDSLRSLTRDIGREFDTGYEYKVGVTTDLDLSSQDLSAINGLRKTVSVNAAAPNPEAGSLHIDTLSIPLEDLEQLRSLEDFLDMLRVRTRQGVAT